MLKKVLTIVISIVLSVVILFLLFSGLYYIRAMKAMRKNMLEIINQLKLITNV